MPASCRACALSSVEPFFDLGDLPLAGGFLDSLAAAKDEQVYPLVISLCDNCGLVQITDPVDPSILFGGYSFKTGTIPGLVAHFADYADWLVLTLGPRSAFEFGCNDGTLVAALEERGVRAFGMDLAENIVDLGRDEGRDIVYGRFGRDAIDVVQERVGAVDVVTGSNVFAHNADPDDIVEAAKAILAPGGALCLEVMYAGDLLELLQWDTLYHEHLTFYSLGTLSALLERHGFDVVEAERIPMHGGSLRIAAVEKGTRLPSASVERVRRYESEVALNAPGTWQDFGENCRRRIDIFGQTMARLATGAEIWAYGAAGKATMWVNACDMDYLTAVVDASPLRAGKFMPGTHTPIVPPDDFRRARPDYVFASAWNYLPQIRTGEPQYQGAWVVPLPQMTVF